MEIKISFKKDEVKEIVKAHALKELGIDVTQKDIFVSDLYGEIVVEITDRANQVEGVE